MSRHFIFISIFIISLTQGIYGQDVFPIPANYGFLCDEAMYLCGNELDGYSGTLLQQDSPDPQPFPICNGQGTAENIQWFSFIADDTIIDISVSFDNCTIVPQNPGISAGIYENCILNTQNFDDFEIACGTIENFSSGTVSLQPDPSIILPGNIYYLYVDGFAGAVCDFNIDVISGVCIEPIPPDITCVQDCGVSNLLFDNQGCTGFEETYNFEPLSMIMEDLVGCNPFLPNAELDSIIHIDWEITPSTGFDILSTPMYFDSLDVQASLSVNWTLPGVYTIKPILSINPLYATCRPMCECTDDVVYTVTIDETILDTLPLIELCPMQSAMFCNQSYDSDIDVTCRDRETCTITVQEIRVLDRVDLPIDTHYICANNPFVFNGATFTDPNLFVIPSPTACDTFINIQLLELDLDVNLTQSESLIDCININAEMTAEYTTNYPDSIQIFWLNEAGDTVSYDNAYVATSEGTYTFYAVPDNPMGCQQTVSNTVTVDDDTPTVSLNAPSPSLDCNTTTGFITITSTDNISTTVWSGPNGYQSTDSSALITEGGLYNVLITTSNGCDITEVIDVPADFSEPDLTVVYDDFDCSENIPLALYESIDSIVSVEWSSSFGVSNEEIYTLPGAGSYTLTVVASNGCTTTENFLVTDNVTDPTLNIDEDYTWRCNDSIRTIDVTSQLDPDLDYQWTNIDGSPASNSQILIIDSPGVYILTGRDTVYGCIGRDTVTITDDTDVFSGIEFIINNPTCFESSDGTIEITSFIGGEEPYTYSYDGVMFTDLADMQFPNGVHTISIFDVYGCEVSQTFEITASESFQIITEPSVNVKFGNNAFLTADVDIDQDQIISYTWTDFDGNFLADGNEVEINGEQETVLVTVEDINGCIATATIDLIIDYNVEIYYPNVFSPNADGSNDNFVVYNNGSPLNMDMIQIFDRAGELIYQQSDILFNESNKGWNGEFNGQVVQPGVYVFIISYTLANGESKIKTGSVTVVR